MARNGYSHQGSKGTFIAWGMAAEAETGTAVLSSAQGNIENKPILLLQWCKFWQA